VRFGWCWKKVVRFGVGVGCEVVVLVLEAIVACFDAQQRLPYVE